MMSNEDFWNHAFFAALTGVSAAGIGERSVTRTAIGSRHLSP